MLLAGAVCPITGERMRDPVIDPEGNSYERAAIEQWLSSHDTSPITRSPLCVADLTPNRALREALQTDAQSPARPAQPPPATPQGVDVQLRVTEASSPGDGEIDMLVRVSPPLGSDATPSDVVCVVDTSGSMGTEATMKNSAGGEESHGLSLLDVVKHAVKTVAASLRPCDRLSLVSYSSTARVVFELMEMTDEGKQAASLAVDALSPGGMTNLWDGLFKGLEQIRSGGAGRQASVLLLTDGLPNVEPPRGHVPMLRRYKDQHGLPLCTVSTFGFGYSLDSALLADLADEGKGSFAFIPDSSFVGTSFVHAVANLRSECAGNVGLALEPAEGVSIVEVVGGGAGEAHPHTLASWGASIPLAPLQFGQSRDVVVRLKLQPGSASALGAAPYITATLKYVGTPSADGPARTVSAERALPAAAAAASGAVAASGAAVAAQRARLTLVARVSEALNFLACKDLPAAQAAVEQLKAEVAEMASSAAAAAGAAAVAAGARAGTEGAEGAEDEEGAAVAVASLVTLQEDLAGQITEALSREDWAAKWGGHYLRSLGRAHALQRCHNFKDPGVQGYGGALFGRLRDEADAIFMSLPPPKPTARHSSRSPSSSGGRAAPRVQMASMSSYNNRGNPCFHGSALVRMADGSRKRCDAVAKGDAVATPGGGAAAVVCVVQTSCDGGVAELVRLAPTPKPAAAPSLEVAAAAEEEPLLVTPWHPVRRADDAPWAFPCELAPEGLRARDCAAVFSFVLDRAPHVMEIGGMQCVALAHGLEGAVVGHPYYATDKVLGDLREMRGWAAGLVRLRTGCDIRDPATGMVRGLSQQD